MVSSSSWIASKYTMARSISEFWMFSNNPIEAAAAVPETVDRLT